MQKYIPVGTKILVEPCGELNQVSSGGLSLVNLTLQKGKIIEISEDFKIYKNGDVIVYPSNAPDASSMAYNGKNCVWLDGRPASEGGHIWFIIESE